MSLRSRVKRLERHAGPDAAEVLERVARGLPTTADEDAALDAALLDAGGRRRLQAWLDQRGLAPGLDLAREVARLESLSDAELLACLGRREA